MSQIYKSLASTPVPPTIVETLTGNTGGAVGPTGNNINVIGVGPILVTGNPGTSTLTISSTESTWTDEGNSFAAVVNSNYFATAPLTMTLPAGAAQGNQISLIADTNGTIVIQANAGQTIRIGNITSSSGGSMTNSLQGDALVLVYRAADSTWIALTTIGVWTAA